MSFGVIRSDEFNYRRNLIPKHMTLFTCNSVAPPVKPNPVRNISIANITYTALDFDDIYKFTALWKPPEFSDVANYSLKVLGIGRDGIFNNIQVRN